MESKLDLIKGVANPEHPESAPLENGNISFISEALGEDEKINELMTNSKPEITVLVGFEGYGKTSFVASCYHYLLAHGKIGEYTFFDSDTFTGLERRLFLRRYNGDSLPLTTKRTLRGEAHLLTFRFSHPKDGEKLVVISDHSGEDYREYSDKRDKIKDDVLLQNADRILLFIDSEKLLGTEYLAMIQRYTYLLTNMRDSGVFDSRPKVQIIFNKKDLVENKKREDRDEMEAETIKKFAEVIGVNITEKFNIVSNNMSEDNKELPELFQDIVCNTVHSVNNSTSKVELDWVKTLLNK